MPIFTQKLIVCLLFLCLTVSACHSTGDEHRSGTDEASQKKEEKGKAHDKKSQKVRNAELHTYDSLTTPAFFSELISNHVDDYFRIDSTQYARFCATHNISKKDSINRNTYYTIRLLHDLLTSQQPANCSKGSVLDIPYFWHWNGSNVRYTIHSVENGRSLEDVEPPEQFSQYENFAKIDRTPYLFLSDLVTSKPQYYSSSCDTFSTFGWCSEREMAFICLTELINPRFQGKVVVRGNHSWTEMIVPMLSNEGDTLQMKVKVDNTYDEIDWTGPEGWSQKQWAKDHDNTDLERFYNKKASSQREKQKINNHIVPKKAAQRIEGKLVEYLNQRLGSAE